MNILVRIGIIKNETLVYGQKDFTTLITNYNGKIHDGLNFT
jgi:hypothetical protein